MMRQLIVFRYRGWRIHFGRTDRGFSVAMLSPKYAIVEKKYPYKDQKSAFDATIAFINFIEG